MEIQHDIMRAVRGGMPSLELHLGRSVCATGRQLSGVVLFRVSKQTSIRSLTVSIVGCESVSGKSLPRAIRKPISFFEREVLLTGRTMPMFRHERMSRLWNEFLCREPGRILSEGQHMYPFSLHLPASLPPSYHGSAGKIDYTVTARIEFPLGQYVDVTKEIPVVFVPRSQKNTPVALSYPTAEGSVQTGGISINVELMQKCVEIGNRLTGRFVIANPRRIPIKEITASLENCEWVRGAVNKEISRSVVESMVIEPENPASGFIEGRFELRVPDNAAPTVEGTAISVLWFLKIYLNSEHPLEFKAPITVYKAL
jgi:hypothetical protein